MIEKANHLEIFPADASLPLYVKDVFGELAKSEIFLELVGIAVITSAMSCHLFQRVLRQGVTFHLRMEIFIIKMTVSSWNHFVPILMLGLLMCITSGSMLIGVGP